MRGERGYQAGVETSLGRFVTMGCDGRVQVGRGRGRGPGRRRGAFDEFDGVPLEIDKRGEVTSLMREESVLRVQNTCIHPGQVAGPSRSRRPVCHID